MLAQTLPKLETTHGTVLPLEHTNIAGTIDGTFTKIALEQHYTNNEDQNIEAVYTFPLPAEAVLLSLTVQLGERILSAEILEKSQAEESYEEAIVSGDTTVMLKKLESGLYTMNVGNLLPGENAKIQMSYALMQSWQGNKLRLLIPTTLAPRYGNFAHDPFAEPVSSALVESHCNIELQVRGELAHAQLESPSHNVNITQGLEGATVTLKDASALMNKDFIFTITSDTPQSFASVSKDIDGYCAYASLCPELNHTEQQPRSLAIVIDCSGSMSGVSIQQARIALAKIVESLSDKDEFNIVLFGSRTKVLFNSLKPASKKYRDRALLAIDTIDANLGGTEIGPALEHAYAQLDKCELKKEMLLITDGEVWSWENIVANAKSDCRIFSVGVGTSVSEAFVKQIAECTGGASEFISPNEDMAEGILRHFGRMRAPVAERVEVNWSESTNNQLTPKVIYHRDTANIFAWFKSKPRGAVNIDFHLEGGKKVSQQVDVSDLNNDNEPLSEFARFIASQKLASLTQKEEIVELAIKYQLISEHTNYLMVDKSPESKKADELPDLRTVSHMTPDGWGGLSIPPVGSVAPLEAAMPADIPLSAPATKCLDMGDAPTPPRVDKVKRKLNRTRSPAQIPDSWDVLDAGIAEELEAQVDYFSDPDEAPQLESVVANIDTARLTIDVLENAGVDDETIEALVGIVGQGHDEATVVLLYLLNHFRKKRGDRETIRKIRFHLKNREYSDNLASEIEGACFA